MGNVRNQWGTRDGASRRGGLAARGLRRAVWSTACAAFALYPASSALGAQEGARWSARYHDLPEIGALLDAWATRTDRDARRLDLGPTAEGRPVPALLFGAEGPEPVERRATVVLLGAPDGLSLSGCEASLAAAQALLDQPDLREDLAVLVVPWAAPDALARTLAGNGDGRGAREGDRDGDGACAEDGPDDLDGDGLLLEMLVEDPSGSWTLAADGRMLVPAPADCTERYRRMREGRDDDGDGRYNEDDGGGVCLDRNFPVGWSAAPADLRGATPLCDPTARALAEDLLRRDLAAVLVFQGDHGGLRVPGQLSGAGAGAAAAEGEVLGELRAAFARCTGRTWVQAEAGTPREPRGELLAWCRAVPGALALECSTWGARVVRSRVEVDPLLPARFDEGALGGLLRRPALEGEDVDWAAWLDGTRGGLGFAEWRAVELPGGVRARVGGWEPRNRRTPPDAYLGRALAGVPEFAVELLRRLPRLDVVLEDARREGDLVHVRARVRNGGSLPTTVRGGGWVERERLGQDLTLELPAGGAVLSGPDSATFPDLEPGSSSEQVEWLVRLEPGAPLRLWARGPGLGRRLREVRP